ncbi:MAG: SDR family oxidoreductase [Chloroflexota bacterium]|nr:SDR family oxidoreductase [Chloroflexota bacterium]
MKLRGQVAVVTGGSRGLGLAVSQRLLQEGAHLVITARHESALAQAGQALRDARAEPTQCVVWQAGDVSNPADVQALASLVDTTFGRIDVLVCNAGVNGPMGCVDALEWGEWVRAIEINLFGAVLWCQAAVPIMRRQKRGKIIMISGGGATRPIPRFSAYSASKAALVRFAETLAAELAGTGIDVNAVAPGGMNTRLLDEVLAAGPDRVGEALFENAVRQQQHGGTSPDTGAALVAFLAGHESDGITGRLLAAVWDDWVNLPQIRERLSGSDVYTLRRIIPADRGWDSP